MKCNLYFSKTISRELSFELPEGESRTRRPGLDLLLDGSNTSYIHTFDIEIFDSKARKTQRETEGICLTEYLSSDF